MGAKEQWGVLMNKESVIRYCTLAGIVALVLMGVKYLAQYLFSPGADWNIAIGVIAIALPIGIQAMSGLWRKQKENQFKLEEIQDAINKIPVIETGIKRIDQTDGWVKNLEDRMNGIEEENRRQERLIARLEAVVETLIQQEQLQSRVDKLSEAIAKLQTHSGGVDE